MLNWEVPQKHAQELDSYPLAMMLQLGKKLKLDTQTLVGVQLQDRELRPLQVEDAGWGVGWGRHSALNKTNGWVCHFPLG